MLEKCEETNICLFMNTLENKTFSKILITILHI